MALNLVIPPYPVFADTAGKPLEGGYIYIGTAGFEARSTPKASYFDKAMLIPTGTAVGAAIRTVGGYPAQNGSAVTVYTDGDFSITVTDKNGVVVYTALNRTIELASTSSSTSILAPDGSYLSAGFGYSNEPTTGRVRSAAGVEQDIVLGNPVSQRSAAGTEFLMPAVGAGVQHLVTPNDQIINGEFAVWQKGGGTFSTAVYTADMWQNLFSGGASAVSRQSHTVGDVFGNETPQYFLRQAVSGQSAAGDYSRLEYRSEGARRFSGKTITIMFWAKRFSGGGNIAVQMEQNFGTGGSPSANVVAGVSTVAISGAWAAYKAVFAVPSVAGKTFGSNADDFITLRFWMSAGSNYNALTNSLGAQSITVDLFGVHALAGDVPVSFASYYRAPLLSDTLRRCQRYYFVTESAINVQSYAITGGDGAYQRVQFPVRMRATPTVSSTFSAGTNCSASIANVGPDGFQCRIVATASSQFAAIYNSGNTADATL